MLPLLLLPNILSLSLSLDFVTFNLFFLSYTQGKVIFGTDIQIGSGIEGLKRFWSGWKEIGKKAQKRIYIYIYTFFLIDFASPLLYIKCLHALCTNVIYSPRSMHYKLHQCIHDDTNLIINVCVIWIWISSSTFSFFLFLLQ